jgi:hypothetical protein
MEPTLGTGLGDIWALLVWPYLLIFVMLSSTIKKAFGDLLQSWTRFEWKPVFTVLLIALIVGVPYALLTEATWVQVLVTYVIGTSFYELIFESVERGFKALLKKLFG